MLIDLAPDPGPAPRPARDLPPRDHGGRVPAQAPSAEAVESFGAVLARLDPSRGPDASRPETRPPADDLLADARPPEASAQDIDARPRPPEQAPIEAHQLAGERGSNQTPPEAAEGRAVRAGSLPKPPLDAVTAATPVASQPPAGNQETISPMIAPGAPRIDTAGTSASARPPEPEAHARAAEAAAPNPRAAEPRPTPSVAALHHGVSAPLEVRAAARDAATPPPALGVEAAERAAVPATLPLVVSERAGFSPAVLEAAVRTRMAETLPKLPGSRVGLAARSLDGGALPFAAALADGAAPGGGADSLADRLLRPPAPAAAEIAREIAQQIGARITPLARGQFELMLAPAELGRVEIALRELDGVLTLSVTAERPETMELIRRHLDLLAQDLRQIAQRELALQLGSGGAGSHAGTARSGAGPFAETADTATPTDPTSPSGPRPGLARDQLDLRL